MKIFIAGFLLLVLVASCLLTGWYPFSSQADGQTVIVVPLLLLPGVGLVALIAAFAWRAWRRSNKRHD